MTVDRRISVKASPVNFPIFIFMFVTLFSVVWSILFRDPFVYVWEKFTIAQIVASMVIVFLPMAFLMVVNFVNSSHPFIIMSLMMIIAGVAGLIKNYLGVNLPVDVRGLFSLWVIGLSFGFVLFLRKLHWSIKLFLLLLMAGWIHYSFFRNITWIAGWFPPLVSMGVLTWMRSKKLLFVFAIFMLGLIASNYDYYVGRVIENEKEESGYSRVEAWKMNWKITRDHLLFGTGPAGYAVYYMTYFPTDAMATHNNYIDILAQTGVVGMFFCLWFFAKLVVVGYKLCRRLRGRGDFSEAIANISLAGTVACIIIMAFGDWLFPFAYTQTIEGYNYSLYNWLFMGAIVVLDRLFPASRQEKNA
jgi:O-antigen ligase